MISQIALTPFLGKSLLFYFGIFSLLVLLATAITGYLMIKGKAKLEQHRILAYIVVIIALIHGLLALAVNFGF
jgi:hypothetical protein